MAQIGNKSKVRIKKTRAGRFHLYIDGYKIKTFKSQEEVSRYIKDNNARP